MITVTNLRKIFTAQGVKGAGSWKREDFNSSIIAAEFAAYAEVDAIEAAAAEHEAWLAQQDSPLVADIKARVASRGKSRAGMVIVAKGSEIHKSETFRIAAEAAGWKVELTSGGKDHFYADAHKGDEAIQLSWEGRAYNYAASSARINGKDRKVRNLKEALRLLAS